MPDPYSLLPGTFHPWAWGLTGAAALVMCAVQIFVNRRLTNGLATSGIASFELAGSGTRSAAILASWNDRARADAALGLKLDFGFLAAYGAFFAVAVAWASHQAFVTWGWPGWIGWIFAGLACLAAAFDAVENVALLAQLPDAPDAGRAATARRFAVLKFGLLGACAAFVGCGVVAAWTYLGAGVEFAIGHVGLVVVAALLYGMVFGLVGGGNGLPSLFWHDSPKTRVSAGLAATVVLLNLGTIAYCDQMIGHDLGEPARLLATLAGPIPWGPGAARGTWENVGYLTRFLVVGGWPFVLLLAAPAAVPGLFPNVPKIPLRKSASGDPDGMTRRRILGSLAWLLGIVLGVATSAALVWLSPFCTSRSAF